jgi:hypothetical protein
MYALKLKRNQHHGIVLKSLGSAGGILLNLLATLGAIIAAVVLVCLVLGLEDELATLLIGY